MKCYTRVFIVIIEHKAAALSFDVISCVATLYVHRFCTPPKWPFKIIDFGNIRYQFQKYRLSISGMPLINFRITGYQFLECRLLISEIPVINFGNAGIQFQTYRWLILGIPVIDFGNILVKVHSQRFGGRLSEGLIENCKNMEV